MVGQISREKPKLQPAAQEGRPALPTTGVRSDPRRRLQALEGQPLRVLDPGHVELLDKAVTASRLPPVRVTTASIAMVCASMGFLVSIVESLEWIILRLFDSLWRHVPPMNQFGLIGNT
jgi:hypothetical protein